MSISGALAGDFDRDGSNYEATNHLMNRLRDRKALTGKMVCEAIEEGEVDDAEVSDYGNICVTLVHKWGAMTYEVVIDVEDRKVITACERGR